MWIYQMGDFHSGYRLGVMCNSFVWGLHVMLYGAHIRHLCGGVILIAP